MAGLRLKKNTKYEMLVVATAPKKQVQRKFKTFPEWVHTVHLQDSEGGNYYCETWLSTKDQQVFVEGQMACFYLEFDGAHLDEIVALDCHDESLKSPQQEVAQIPEGTREHALQTLTLTDIAALGKMDLHLVALLIAKDIFTAQIIAGKLNGNGPDLSWMFVNAEYIYKELKEQIEPSPF